MSITRTETLVFKASLQKSEVERHAEALKTIGCMLNNLIEGDTLRATYTVYVSYLDEVDTKLAAFQTLLDDPTLVVSADIAELEHGHSILVAIVEKITRIREGLADRKSIKASRPLPNMMRRVLNWWSL